MSIIISKHKVLSQAQGLANNMESPIFADIKVLVDEYRDRCLWFLRPGFSPETPEEAMRALDLIERYGDRAAFQRAERLKKWLLPHFKAE